VVLDLGANVDCSAENLVQFALMGAVFARTVLHHEQPTVGLLNIGEEEIKGSETLKNAAAILRDSDLPMEFVGFVEGDDITNGTTDVVVTDGFTGNVALKAAEGAAGLYTEFLRSAFSGSLMARIGYLFARSAMLELKKKVDPRYYNGAVFIGLNGISVKSHGGMDDFGFSSAINVAIELVADNVNDRIIKDLRRYGGAAKAAE